MIHLRFLGSKSLAFLIVLAAKMLIIFCCSMPASAIGGRTGFGWDYLSYYVVRAGAELTQAMSELLDKSGFMNEVKQNERPELLRSDMSKPHLKAQHEVAHQLLSSKVREAVYTLYPKGTFTQLQEHQVKHMFPTSTITFMHTYDRGTSPVHRDTFLNAKIEALFTIHPSDAYGTLYLPQGAGSYEHLWPKSSVGAIKRGELVNSGKGNVVVHFTGVKGGLDPFAPPLGGFPLQPGTPHSVPPDPNNDRVVARLELLYEPEDVPGLPRAHKRMMALRLAMLLDEENASAHVGPLLDPKNEFFHDPTSYINKHMYPQLMEKYKSLSEGDKEQIEFHFKQEFPELICG